jgi:hypothetical protein
MFKNNNSKQGQLIKEVVKMKNILICMIFVVVAFCATTNALAITTPVSAPAITVSATVPVISGGLSVTVSKYIGTVGTPVSAAMPFGNLVLGSNGVFAPSDGGYYGVDIGVTDNTGTNWQLQHVATWLARTSGTAANINNKVNVTFSKQLTGTSTEWQEKYTYGEALSKSYTKSLLTGGWLRIYYGIATGEAGKDATNATPIGLDTPSGTYSGTVTITLAPLA